MDFYQYRNAFEGRVASAIACRLADREFVSVRQGRLVKGQMAKLLGTVIEPPVGDFAFVVNYYGYIKRSRGFLELVEKHQRQLPGRQLGMVKVLSVHFASIHIEDVERCAPELVAGFPAFKRIILKARGFISG